MRPSYALTSILLILLALPVLAGATADYNPETDFTKLKTFSLKKGTPAPSPLTQERIEKAVVRELEAKGLQVAKEGTPDLFVVTHVGLSEETRVDVNDYGYGYRGYRWGGYGSPDVTVYKITMGTLVVDLVDAKTEQLVWRGSITDAVNPPKDPEKAEAKINKYVAKILKKFPPQK